MAKQHMKHGGEKKYGRNKNKCAAYRLHKTREKNKLKRILQSCGFGPALSYSRANGLPDPKRKERM